MLYNARREFLTSIWLLFCISCVPAFAHGEPREELDRLDASLSTNPNQLGLLIKRAEIHRRYEHFDEALGDLRRAKSLSPNHDRIGFLIGRTLADKGEYGAAEVELSRHLKGLEGDVQGQAELARVLRAQEKYRAAVDAYDKVIALQEPPLPEHYLSRADALVQAGDLYLDEALEGIEEGMDELGPLIILQRLAIRINLRQGDCEAALSRIDEIIQNIQRKESWLVERARILLLMGQHENAQKQLSLAQSEIDSLPLRIRNSAAMIDLRSSITKLMNP